MERALPRFRELDAQVVGISCDPRPTLAAWAPILGGISFPLLSDFWPHGEVTQRYGVFREAGGSPERAIFVVDRRGRIRYVDVHEIKEVPDPEQLVEVLERLDD